MLSYPKNYEEAKIIIKNSVNDDYTLSKKKQKYLRSGFITLVSIGAAFGLGALTGNMNYAYCALPLSMAASLFSMRPILRGNIAKKTIEDGSYFNRPEQEVIDIAKAYVDEYNAYESRKK